MGINHAVYASVRWNSWRRCENRSRIPNIDADLGLSTREPTAKGAADARRVLARALLMAEFNDKVDGRTLCAKYLIFLVLQTRFALSARRRERDSPRRGARGAAPTPKPKFGRLRGRQLSDGRSDTSRRSRQAGRFGRVRKRSAASASAGGRRRRGRILLVSGLFTEYVRAIIRSNLHVV